MPLATQVLLLSTFYPALNHLFVSFAYTFLPHFNLSLSTNTHTRLSAILHNRYPSNGLDPSNCATKFLW
ncbi:hypothetical protein K443DRAFT_329879 [Laccaria amethystina LaAM-08-1]|uniref:Uncharacterized protein n=1 Tax=Laccaria amethystina LaAM-08-1 TaxID=1095629 RepID=A0A0C9XGU4_9AGAR|nr:hypothetical protein K443DRAFT_329879 [Laccaria amethystina LaAM-08-1]